MMLTHLSTPNYNNIKNPPPSHHHLQHTTKENIECNPNDNLREQLTVLTEAIRILTRIVTTPSPPCSSESFDAEKKIEQLHLTWRLEDTGFSKLFNACKQMQDALRLTSLEADKAFDDVQRASDAAVVREREDEMKNEKIFTLQEEILELERKNQILMGEVKDHKKQKKVIARSVRKFVNAMNEGHTDSSAPTTPNNQGLGLNNIPQLQYITSISPSFSTSEEDSEEISPPLVTDDGCATVRLAQRQARKSKRERVSTIRSKKKIRQRNVLELKFPSKNVGIQFTSVSQKSFASKSKDAKEALLICGFLGFDDTLNRRPTFGSRLVCVDGISVEKEGWKMENLIDYICAKEGPLQMSFRNEFLTTAQIAQLKKTETGN